MSEAPAVAAPVLAVSSIETLYHDRIYALSGVSLELREREIFAVLGPNGAGKTTLLKTIAGLLKDQPKKGIIRLDGERIERRQPEEVADAGVVFVPEDRGLFRELTVAENLELGMWGKPRAQARDDLGKVLAMFPRLEERLAQQADTLSGGEQQMLAIGRSLLRRPRLLLLDEPSLGLTPEMSRIVFDALVGIAASGTTVLLVEQNARLALRVAHRAAILETGRIVLTGTPRELAEHPDVRDVYLGIGQGDAAEGKAFRLYRKRRRW
ncbi:MAG TPA: ABC transporter ATP-binding protein [Anaeromyxobacteraceae bacterium]|nr:ABC transporter ATP-binding protein [Anaeromyxobacteraceae bacterium]